MPAPRKPRSPSPDPEATAALPEGEASSTDSSAAEPDAPAGAGGFFSDAGPGFDADAAKREPEPQPVAGEVLDTFWEEDTVKGLLTAQGAAVHSLIGKGEEDWVYTRQELGAIAGPLTRILNRYPVTQAAAGTGDELAVILGLTGYVTRSVKERRAVLAAQEPEEEVRIAGPTFGAGAPAAPPSTADQAAVLDDDVVDFQPID